MKRYSLDTTYIGNGMSVPVATACKTGDWVKYSSIKTGWVSVKKDLPKPNVKCLTYSPALEDPYRILCTNNGKFYSDVTHWMLLPKAPGENNG